MNEQNNMAAVDVVLVEAGVVAQVWRNADLATIAEAQPDLAAGLFAVEANLVAPGFVMTSPGTFSAPGLPSEVLAARIKSECARRISEILKDLVTQANITAYILDLVERKVAGDALAESEQSDVEMSRAVKEWVSAMREVSRGLILAGNATFASDAHWPAPPAGARAFADRF